MSKKIKQISPGVFEPIVTGTIVDEVEEITAQDFNLLNKMRIEGLQDRNCVITKPTSQIRLDKLKTTQQAARDAKALTINLPEFIGLHYSFAPTYESIFKCTIKDIGLHPFEIDVYDNRVILVEVTGKTRKDFDGNDTPERIYRGRNHNLSGALNDIAHIMANRKIQGGESTVITMKEYAESFKAIQKYIANIINKDYGKALEAMYAKVPFTKISIDNSDEEDWFNNKHV